MMYIRSASLGQLGEAINGGRESNFMFYQEEGDQRRNKAKVFHWGQDIAETDILNILGERCFMLSSSF